MEAAALYALAAKLDKQAMAILTVSNHLLESQQRYGCKERETKFKLL